MNEPEFIQVSKPPDKWHGISLTTKTLRKWIREGLKTTPTHPAYIRWEWMEQFLEGRNKVVPAKRKVGRKAHKVIK